MNTDLSDLRHQLLVNHLLAVSISFFDDLGCFTAPIGNVVSESLDRFSTGLYPDAHASLH